MLRGLFRGTGPEAAIITAFSIFGLCVVLASEFVEDKNEREYIMATDTVIQEELDNWKLNHAQQDAATQRDRAVVAEMERDELRDQLQEAVYRLKDMLMGDDGQAWSEAERALPKMEESLNRIPAPTKQGEHK